MQLRAIAVALAAVAAGCSSLLPGSSRVVDGNWDSYAQAQQAFEAIKPHETTLSDLKALKLDPYMNANVAILNYTDVAQRFLPDTGAMSINDLDVEIQSCLRAKTACTGLQVHQTGKTSQRNGNFFTDTLGFHRHTESLGWNFDGLILVQNDIVVYRVTGGQPTIHEHADESNPLGPLQNIAKKFVSFP